MKMKALKMKMAKSDENGAAKINHESENNQSEINVKMK
jgi:hypothetical protein